MGRPSLADIRRRQILLGYEECVLKYGMEGSTLERIAAESGIQRSVIRHYMGNRQAMTQALVAEMVRRMAKDHEAALRSVPSDGDLGGGLIEFIAGPGFPDPREDALIDALVAASHRNPDLRGQLRAIYRSFQRAISQELRNRYPNSDPAATRRAAYGLTCLAYGHASMTDLGIPTREVPDVRKAAWAIVRELGEGLERR